MISMAGMLAKGMAKAKSHSKAKAVPVDKNMKKGMALFAEKMAIEFVNFLHERTEPGYQLEVLGIEISKNALLRSVERKEAIVTIQNSKYKTIPYWEIWRYFEYGRMDQGILPDPVLKKVFIDFRPIYIESLKKELTKGRKK